MTLRAAVPSDGGPIPQPPEAAMKKLLAIVPFALLLSACAAHPDPNPHEFVLGTRVVADAVDGGRIAKPVCSTGKPAIVAEKADSGIAFGDAGKDGWIVHAPKGGKLQYGCSSFSVF